MAGLEQHVSIFDKQLSFTVLIQLGIKSTKRTFFLVLIRKITWDGLKINEDNATKLRFRDTELYNVVPFFN